MRKKDATMYKIEVKNFEKYNPNIGKHKYASWFRLENTMVDSIDMIDLNEGERWMWIVILSHCCLKRASKVFISDLYVASKMSQRCFKSASFVFRTLYKFEQKQLLKVLTRTPYIHTDIKKLKNFSTDRHQSKSPIIINNKKKEDDPIIINIIDYLNLKISGKFKYSSKATTRCISSRLKEGYKEEDFKKVIDIKTSKWKDDPKMNDFLRPQTLFSENMESYLNETPQQTQQDIYDEFIAEEPKDDIPH